MKPDVRAGDWWRVRGAPTEPPRRVMHVDSGNVYWRPGECIPLARVEELFERVDIALAAPRKPEPFTTNDEAIAWIAAEAEASNRKDARLVFCAGAVPQRRWRVDLPECTESHGSTPTEAVNRARGAL